MGAAGRRLVPQREAAREIAASDLSLPVRDRIGAIVRRTRLSSAERLAVARELIGRAEDARAAGLDDDAVLRTLGEPRGTARLLRRAAKRRRPTVRMLGRVAVCGAVLLALLFGVRYAMLAIPFYRGAPTITTDYYALLHERLEGFSEDEVAWRVYAEARGEWRLFSEDLRQRSNMPRDRDGRNMDAGIDTIPVPTSHPDYDLLDRAFQDFRPTLDRIIDASRRPLLGFPYTDRFGTYDSGTGEQWIDVSQPLPPTPDTAEQEPLLEVLIPHVGDSRAFARALSFESRRAADAGDADRATDAATALLNIARQLAHDPFALARQAAASTADLALRNAIYLAIHYGDLLSDDHIDRLNSAIISLQDSLRDFSLAADKYASADLAQRLYTDNGRGGGRLTAAGARVLCIVDPRSPGHDLVAEQSTLRGWLMAPIHAERFGDRHLYTLAAESPLTAAEQAVQDGPFDIPVFLHRTRRVSALTRDYDLLHDLLRRTSFRGNRYLSAVDSTLSSIAHGDAARIVLAIEAFRRVEDRLPVDLEELAPRFVAAVPPDPYDPGAPITYRPSSSDPNTYFVYLLGSNGEDYGGVPPGEYGVFHAVEMTSLILRYHPDHEIEHPDGAPPDYLLTPPGDWVFVPPDPTR